MNTYNHIRCEVCGVAWSDHSPDCSRHVHGPPPPPVILPPALSREDLECRLADLSAEVARLTAVVAVSTRPGPVSARNGHPAGPAREAAGNG